MCFFMVFFIGYGWVICFALFCFVFIVQYYGAIDCGFHTL